MSIEKPERRKRPALDTRSDDDAHLEALGYENQFERKMSLWANFALGFVYLSPMVSVVSIFALGLSEAGPPAIWWIVLIGGGQLLVAFVFGEIVSQYPVAGGLYQWARRLWGGRYSWAMSWTYICCITIGITTTALFSSDFIASLFGGTESEPSVTPSDGQRLGITLAVLAICLAFNLTGTKTLARLSQIGLACEVAGIVIVGVYLLIFERKNDFGVFFDTLGAGDGDSPYFYAFLGASLVGLYMFYGFESCGEVAEETPNPARAIPKAMIMTVVLGGFFAVVAFAGYVLAAPNLQAIVDGEDSNPIPSILQDSIGIIGTKLFLVSVLTAFLAGVMGQQAAVSRLVFSFGRDNMFPGAAFFAKTSKRHVPSNALIAINIIPVALVVFVFFEPGSQFRIAAFQVLAGYFAFQMVVFAALRMRLKGWRPGGPWSLGRFGFVVNIGALIFGVLAMIVLAKPSSEPGLAFYDRWIALIGFLVVLGVGLAYLFIAKPERNSTAPEGDAIEVAERLSSARNR
ncbi:APC family permease [Williamsia sp. D3]|uniref:APC family permease n=1 Tax=Williamsia sp. D3 TaxID=1313067 RepID=UPI0003D357D2|nr:APC family permease [Williamsia sp. D3]ETD33266.1 amino acid transporter [Williamsia sp. D3]